MKKYKEWLTNEIEIMESETSENYPHEQMVEREVVLNLIDQLDEPETHQLKDKIKELDDYNSELIRDNNQLRNELDKQELPVLPKHVADWIEENRKWYKNSLFEIGYDLYNNAIHPDVDDWIIENEERFMRAWLDGYRIAEEPKYYVNLNKALYVAKCKDDDQVDIYTDGILGSDDFEFHLTEKEIKNYDERFWAFAEPIEELEE